MAFKDILGNERQKKILKRALQKERIPNSLLFCGPEGVGKRTLALVLAKAMNCETKADDACEACSSCRAISRGNFPDVMVISPENKMIRIDQMRILKQTAYLRPMAGKKRFFIVTETDKMNDEAANSLLKILEEPPSFSHIILITSNPEMIKPTIKSRCQTLSFQPISKEDIEKMLVERGFGKERAKIVSLLVGGNLKKALNMEWEEVQSRRARAWEMLLSLYGKKKVADFLRSYSFSRGQIKEELEELLELLSSFCRDLILIQEKGDLRLLMNPDYKQRYVKASDLLTLQKSMDWLGKMDYALYALQKNLNVNLLLTSLFSEG